MSGIASGLPGDGGSIHFVELIGFLHVEAGGELGAFEVLVGLEGHLDSEAVVFGVESGLDTVAVSDDGAIFVSNDFVSVSVSLEDSGPEITDSLGGGGENGLNVARLIKFDIGKLIVLQLIFSVGVLHELLGGGLDGTGDELSALLVYFLVHDLVLELNGTEGLLFLIVEFNARVVEDLEGFKSIADVLGHQVDVFAHAELSLGDFGISLFNHGIIEEIGRAHV